MNHYFSCTHPINTCWKLTPLYLSFTPAPSPSIIINHSFASCWVLLLLLLILLLLVVTGNEMGSVRMEHVLLVSFGGQGHINPALRLAKRLAAKGLLVTFSSTTYVGCKIRASAATTLVSDGEPISVAKGHLRFEFFPDGWDFQDARRNNLHGYLLQLKEAAPAELAALIRRQADQSRPVRYIIGNPFVPWVFDVASDMAIPCGLLWVQSCAVFSLYYHYHHHRSSQQQQQQHINFPSKEQPDVTVKLPGMPVLEASDIPSFLLPDNIFSFIAVPILAQIQKLSKDTCVLVNSFEELEADVFKSLAGIQQLIPIGPLVELPDHAQEKKVKADLIPAANECMAWLDEQKPNSVVYVSVGSVVRMEKEEMEEMAWGLKSCQRPFLWVVRDESRPLLPAGFNDGDDDELKGQGMIVKWSPQDQILTHPSVSCFLTHCGWNSTLESLAAGVPVIAFSHWGDQPTNAKFLVDVYGVGVYLRPASTGEPSFGREDVKNAVTAVTEGQKAEEKRKRATRWKEAAREAAAEGGSPDQNMEALMKRIRGVV